jgi:hypothetical protein
MVHELTNNINQAGPDGDNYDQDKEDIEHVRHDNVVNPTDWQTTGATLMIVRLLI